MRWANPHRRRVLEGVAVGTVGALLAGTVGTTGARTAPTIAIRETNAPVAAGERLAVTGVVRNRGAEETTVETRLVVGHDPETVDADAVTVEPGSSERVVLDYETALVERTQTFPVRLETASASAERPVTVLGTDDGAAAAIRPSDAELAVRPGTSVLFELAARAASDPTDVEWDADDEIAGDLALATDYGYATGLWAYLAAPETTGTYDVRARVAGGSTVQEWTLHVADSGRAAPTIEELSTDPGADATVGVDDAVEVELRARDRAGDLDRVIWLEGQNHTVVGVDDLEGTADGATLAREYPGWIAAGYPTMARVVCEDGRTSELVTDEGPEIRPPFAVEIVGTNEPVSGGEYLEVTAEVENEGHMMMVGDTTQEVELIVGRDPELVDTATVTVPAGAVETVTLGYETYPVARDDEFPVRVETPDDSAERTVTVSGVGS